MGVQGAGKLARPGPAGQHDVVRLVAGGHRADAAQGVAVALEARHVLVRPNRYAEVAGGGREGDGQSLRVKVVLVRHEQGGDGALAGARLLALDVGAFEQRVRRRDLALGGVSLAQAARLPDR